MNCRGLGDLAKRKDVFNFLKQKAYSIYCIQDTHFTAKEESFIRSMWGFEIYNCPGTSESRGVAILFNNNFEFKVNSVAKDDDGNFIALNICIEKNIELLLVNIYGPNRDTPSFYMNLKQFIQGNEHDFVVISGDFNLVQDAKLDYYNYKHINNPRSKQELHNLKQELSMCDPWRIQHEQLRKYTWSSNNPAKRARLDFFLISEELMPLVNKTNIKEGYRSDHNLIELELKLSNFKKQSGFWKFNTLLLRDKEYVEKVKQLILDLKREYAASPYERSEITNIPNNEIALSIDEQSFFELILLNIRGMTIPYSTYKKKEKNYKKNNLESQIEILNKLTSINVNSTIFQEMLTNSKEELENIRKEEIKGLFLRSKAKWIEEGEKPSKYFCHLEKRNYLNKTVTKLLKNDGKEITNQIDILHEIEHFYRKLYTSKDRDLEEIELNNLIRQENIIKLDNTTSQKLDEPLTYNEVLNSLKRQKMRKVQEQMAIRVNSLNFFGMT